MITALLGAAMFANKRVLILGDSLTQDGRYVAYLEYALEKHNPRAKFDIVNTGLASETTSGLTEEGHPGPRPNVNDRIERALADVKPQIVIACYGMNDGIYKPLDPDRTKAFQDGIAAFVGSCRRAGSEVVLITPPAFETDAQGGIAKMGFDYNAVLDSYARWEMKTRPGGATVVDLHFPMTRAMVAARKAGRPLHGDGDGAHPNDYGYFTLARLVMQALKVPAPPESDMASIQADPLFKLIRQCADMRTAGWLEYVGYSRLAVTHPPHTTDIVSVEAKVADLQRQIDDLLHRSVPGSP